MRKTVAGTTSDPTIQFTDLEIEDKTYHLVFTYNVIANAEKSTGGCNLLHGLAGLMAGTANAEQYRGMLYAALHTAHPAMTLDQAGALIDYETWNDIRLALLRAYNASLPEKKRLQVEVVATPDLVES